MENDVFPLGFLIQNVFHVFSVSLPTENKLPTQTKPGLVTEHHIGPLSHTPMLMFQAPVQTSAFMRRRERNANCCLLAYRPA
ncbi:hypothetical protein TNCV_3635971 [Trichonephila clavipes]|nr:hypothetical protein TNCV_3635971 [Trichonephila clavipes]